MKHIMVRYTVLADQAQDNERYIGEVFAQLERERPAGLEYASYKLPDQRSFIHLATLADDDVNPLLTLEAFRRFSEGIRQRCVEPPVSAVVERLGAFPSATSGPRSGFGSGNLVVGTNVGPSS